MLKNTFSAILIIGLVMVGSSAIMAKGDDISNKVEDLISRMTLEEKVGQLQQYSTRWEMTGPVPDGKVAQEMHKNIKDGLAGSMLNIAGAEATRKAQEMAVNNSRLGIPMIFGYDVVHGYKTIFPIPLAAAASWDVEAVKTSARVAAKEAAADGLHWTFAPMVDISRDARWGRVMEGAGEDPYLGSVMAKAQVEGFQGGDLTDETTIAACAKHFAAYGFVEGGRDYNIADIGESTLRNVVLPPCKACSDAGVATFMNSFNEVDGIPATGNAHLLRDILKGEWGFDGFVVSDWASIDEMRFHGVAANKSEAALLAITAGSDMDMEGHCYFPNLIGMVEKGEVDEALIDDAVRRILTIKFRLGLFDDPYRYCNQNVEEVFLSAEHLEKARDVARKSIVLLKNENQLLPLSKENKKIAVIGDLADDKDTPLGNWRGRGGRNMAVSLLEGLQNAVENKSLVTFEQGPVFAENLPQFGTLVQINETDRTGLTEAVEAAKDADVVVLALGENCFQSGEARSQSEIGLKGLQQELLEAVCAVNKNVVVVLMNGRPMAISWMAEHVSAIVESWHLGSEAGNAIADVLFGDYNPSGKLPMSFPRTVGQCPIYYNHKNTGRPAENEEDYMFTTRYVDEKVSPLFSFGYGLSYTTFDYSGLELSNRDITKGDTLKVAVNLKNTGEMDGTEVVQLYIRDLVGSVTRPVKELKNFKKVFLKSGETKKIEFELTVEDLTFYSKKGVWEAEPGEFHLWVGTNSSEGLQSQFYLK
ncbi:beta-glucosidase BglX [Sunxiuqinia indica]|uniref:beta-glucosidase BglX n=1 Tax=Sunxiuqinia indica TaxID=2692584 RepID=UPI00135A8DA2|nr:beta-glucosidase BglX [Sunxiuqinia indica]